MAEEDDNFRVETQTGLELANLLVSELWILGWKEWDIEMVEEIFSKRDAQEIDNIPLNNQCHQDTLIWHYDKRGRYTVKSGYHIARKLSMQVLNEQRDEGWNIIWDLDIPPRIKLLLWRASKECLSTRLNLCKRGMPITDTCVLCEATIESTLHLFTKCSYAEAC